MDAVSAAPPPDDLTAILKGVSRSFYLSIRLLPRVLQRPVGLGYLLARATDTVADTTDLPADQRSSVLTELASSIASGTDASALAGMVKAFAPLQKDGHERDLILGLPQCLAALRATPAEDRDDIRTVLRHITRGQMLDITRFGVGGPCRVLDTAAQLEDYTYLVAGSVGEFWTDLCTRHLPGFSSQPVDVMRAWGRSYGCGLQLVNILRDAGADFAAGRCYLPADELAAHGLVAQDIATQPRRLAPVWRHWHARAEAQLEDGMRYAQALNRGRLRAASALPALLGARTLALLHDAGPSALVTRVKVPRGEVYGVVLHMLITFAARGPMLAQFERLREKTGDGGWDNAGNDTGTVRPAEGGRLGQ
jgi:farnesyl-diphosphate farnesyltransferase